MRITGFVWLEQYVEKLGWKHDVTPEEVEAMFFARPTYRFVEKGHVPISARSMDDAEKKRYGRK